MGNQVSRRSLLKGAAAGIAGIAVGKLEANTGPKIQTQKIRFGIIGSGGKGWSGMEAAAGFGDIVALCDIDANNRTKAMLEHPRASAFDDYRKMLDMMHRELDAVVISIPDHHHAPASAMAMHYGLHCYTEKPLTRTIWEERQLVRIAQERHLATQMGNQSTASTPMRKVAALIRQGHFGRAKEVHLWTNRAKGWWNQGVPRPAPSTAPKEVDFELWLGPRPERPYAEGYHPFSWRGWWDFGTGALGDMGCHIFNMPYMALDLIDPIAVKAETSGHNRDSYPEWSKVHYEFGERNGRAPLTVHWYDGGQKPAPELAPGIDLGGNGSLVVCDKATILCPDELNTTFKLISGEPIPDIEVEESPGHMAEFARAVLGGPPARANFPGYAGRLAETVLLGNLAVWADGPRLEWDAHHMSVIGSQEYDELLRPKFRPGWSV